MTRFTIVCVCWMMWIVPSEQLENVALNKNASQSSTRIEGYASRAVDGDTSSCQLRDSTTQTTDELNPHWWVDLDGLYVIDHVKVYNRLDRPGTTDNYAERTNNVQTNISVDGENYNTVCFHGGVIPDVYTCQPEGELNGRWVKVTVLNFTKMNICEVEVMSSGLAVLATNLTTNLTSTPGRDLFTSVQSVKGSGDILQTEEVYSNIHCASLCSVNVNCTSVNFVTNPSGMQCQLLGSDQSSSSDEENVEFWKLT